VPNLTEVAGEYWFWCRYRFTKGIALFSVYISSNNLFDVAYQNHLSRLKYAAENQITGRAGVFNAGRNFSFKIVVPIAFK
jgi:iron complex outermembrane recepter protein